MAGERRKYLRVLFEETIEVVADEWTDSMATGLDISLNGTRFHCEHSLAEGEFVTVRFTPDFELKGEVRWCWPIEWYYQAALEFNDLTKAEQQNLQAYITDVTGEPYPDYSDEADSDETEAEDKYEEEELEEIEIPEIEEGEEDLFENDLGSDEEIGEISFEEDVEYEEESDYGGPINPLSFRASRVLLLKIPEDHANLISQYLETRNGFEVSLIEKMSNLWPLLKAQPPQVIMLGWSNEDAALSTLEELAQKAPAVPVIFFSGPVTLEDRLTGINAGAIDFISRPVHISAISQKILQLLNQPQLMNFDETPEEEEDEFGEDLDLTDDFEEDDF